MTEPGADAPFLVDPYLVWVRNEGVPVHEDFGFDLRGLELRPWARMDARGAYAHALGRGAAEDVRAEDNDGAVEIAEGEWLVGAFSALNGGRDDRRQRRCCRRLWRCLGLSSKPDGPQEQRT